MRTDNAANPLRLHTILSLLVLGVGLVLMVGKMYADSEPGAVPLLLVAAGGGWYLVTRGRGRGAGKKAHVGSRD